MNNHDEIISILDRSGSMASQRADAIGGFNRFIDDQKKISLNARMTLVLFDNNISTVYDGIDLAHVRALDEYSYVPCGGTALLDAVGTTIDRVGARLAATPEIHKPKKVIVAILTDGEENASREYTMGQVSRMIEHQRGKYNWDFFFLGANCNVWTVAQNLNIPKSNAFSYDSRTAYGMANGFASYSNNVTASRAGSVLPNTTLGSDDAA